MSLVTGSRLGPYEILAPLGAGGMGEVYKARDTRLNRTVAIKVLPPHANADPHARDRFVREAQAVAALEHPHICVLHDIGRDGDVDFLVMEFLEGETLASRLEKAPLSIAQVLRHAVEIASALDKAHRRGIIHRDLKPANIMLTKAGAKLLDFGLAKLRPIGTPVQAGTPSAATEAAPLTSEGSILGTLQHMAPEQLESREVDARTDIFAFGAIVHEMATRTKAFAGASQASVIASILDHTPPLISKLEPKSPRPLDDIVRRCLAKDPDERWQSAADLTFALDGLRRELSETSASAQTHGVEPSRRLSWGVVIAAITVTAIAASLALVGSRWSNERASQPPVRLLLSEQVPALPGIEQPSLSISRDGQRVVYVAESGGIQRLHLRELQQTRATVIAGTDNAVSPFFSPDGQRIGFFADRQLKTVAVAGGAPVVLASVENSRGGTWGPDDTIIYAPTTDAGLWQVPAAGGTPRVLAQPDPFKGERGYRWPQMLPAGDGVLFTLATSRILSFDDAHVAVRSLRTGEQRELIRGGSFATYAVPGQLLYARAGALITVPFDQGRQQVSGPPTTVQSDLLTHPFNGAAQFALALNGTLVYIPGGAISRKATLTWVARSGTSSPLEVPSAAYNRVSISPDGQQVAVNIDGANAAIWILNLPTMAMTRLTLEWSNSLPFWTSDGARVGFISARRGIRTLFWQSADGQGSPERLVADHQSDIIDGSFAPDGKTLIFEELGSTTGRDLWVIPLAGDRKPTPFLRTSFNEQTPQFSPDGRWVAYVSDESGRNEVYVQPYPGPGRKWPVSTGGGTVPVWARNGHELFYRNGDATMAAKVSTSPAFVAAAPQLLFRKTSSYSGASPVGTYDVGPDGRFLMIEDLPSQELEAPVTVVLNWLDDVQRRLSLTR